jgi:hypothetical protein
MRSESVAKTLMCPFAVRGIPVLSPQGAYIGAAAVNRPTTNELNCVGSRCMAWEVSAISKKLGRCIYIGDHKE